VIERVGADPRGAGAAADMRSRLDQRDAGAGRAQICRRRQARHPGADHEDVLSHG
jgi:hypothetical protein